MLSGCTHMYTVSTCMNYRCLQIGCMQNQMIVGKFTSIQLNIKVPSGTVVVTHSD